MTPRTLTASAVAASVLLLSGCGGGEPESGPLADTSWEIVAVYVDPSVPGDVPADAAGRAGIAFGGQSLTARTGCAPLQAAMRIDDNRLHLEEVKLRDPDEQKCVGGTRRVHDQLTGILTTGSEFEMRRYGEGEMTLRKVNDGLDPATIRMVKQ